jgi:hypothetical protein
MQLRSPRPEITNGIDRLEISEAHLRNLKLASKGCQISKHWTKVLTILSGALPGPDREHGASGPRKYALGVDVDQGISMPELDAKLA